jgi:hypothetical protein
MNQLLIKVGLVSVLLLVLIGAVSASPGIKLTVEPRNSSAQPGDTITYTVVVESITTETEHVTLSMEDEVSGWGYVFSEPEFDLAPGETKTSNLDVSVPASAPVGTYESKVKAGASLLSIPGMPPIEIEKSYFTIVTTAIPEFQSILIPVAALFSIFFFLRRKRRNIT